MTAPTIQKALSGTAANTASAAVPYNYFGYTGANSLVILAIGVVAKDTTRVSVTDVTDTNTGMVYRKYTDKEFVSVNDGNLTNALACGLEIWWARGTISSDTGTITVNLDGTCDGIAVAGNVFTGSNVSVFDVGGIQTWTNTTPTATVNGIAHNTNTADTCIMWAAMSPSIPSGLGSYNNLDVTYGGSGSDNTTALGSTFNSFGWVWCLLSEKAYTSVQTGLAMDGTHSLYNQQGIAFAITADVPALNPDLTYANHNGSGDRRSTITITTNRADFFLNRDDGTSTVTGPLGDILPMLVDGAPTTTTLNNPAYPNPPYPFSFAINPSVTAGDWIKFQFDVAEKLQGFFSKGSADWNNGVGVWQWYGSNDDSTYILVGPEFTWNNDENNYPGPTNESYYLYYKLQMVSGTVSGSSYADAPIQTEFEFKLLSVGETPIEDGNYANLFGSDAREPGVVVVTTSIGGSNYSGYIGNLVSGSTGGSDTNNAIIFGNFTTNSNGQDITFAFPRPTAITEVTLYQSGGFNEGTYSWQWSDDGSTWADTGAVFTWDQVVTTFATGTRDAHLYWRMLGTVNQNYSAFPWLFEAQFKTVKNSDLEIGDRSSLITVTTTLTVNTGNIQSIVDGVFDSPTVTFNESTVSGKEIVFDFGSTSAVIVGVQCTISNNTDTYGDYQVQTWDDVGSAWVNISGATFTLQGVTPVNGNGQQSIAFTWTNTTSSKKLRFLGTGGTANDGGNSFHEFNFMVAGASPEHDITVEFTDEDGFDVEIPFPRVDFTDEDGFDATITAIPVTVVFKDDHGFTAVMVDHGKPYRVQVIVVTT